MKEGKKQKKSKPPQRWLRHHPLAAEELFYFVFICCLRFYGSYKIIVHPARIVGVAENGLCLWGGWKWPNGKVPRRQFSRGEEAIQQLAPSYLEWLSGLAVSVTGAVFIYFPFSSGFSLGDPNWAITIENDDETVVLLLLRLVEHFQCMCLCVCVLLLPKSLAIVSGS